MCHKTLVLSPKFVTTHKTCYQLWWQKQNKKKKILLQLSQTCYLIMQTLLLLSLVKQITLKPNLPKPYQNPQPINVHKEIHIHNISFFVFTTKKKIPFYSPLSFSLTIHNIYMSQQFQKIKDHHFLFILHQSSTKSIIIKEFMIQYCLVNH